MFSNLSSSSISLATVTPSLVMRGAPNDLSSRTLRPLGPSVTRTAWVSVSMPCNIRSRASTENFTSLADISVFLFVRPHSGNDYWASPNDDGLSIRCFPGLRGARFTVSSRTRIWRAQSGGLLLGLGLDQHPHNVALFHDEVLDAVDFDLGARPFAEQDAVADLDVDRNELAALVAAAGSNGDDLALLRLLLGGVGNDDATSGLRLGIDSLDDNAVVKRSEFHRGPPTVLSTAHMREQFDIASAQNKELCALARTQPYLILFWSSYRACRRHQGCHCRETETSVRRRFCWAALGQAAACQCFAMWGVGT